MKFASPTKKMMQALEEEGLRVDWPNKPTDEEELAIDGVFYTGLDWEKLVLIDLRHRRCGTKKETDEAIADELQSAYDNYDVEEEMKVNMEGTAEERAARGVPDAARLLEDMKEQEERLKRFAEVANAVASGKPVPPELDNRKIEIDGATAENIVALLEYAMNHGASEGHCKPIIDEITHKLEG